MVGWVPDTLPPETLSSCHGREIRDELLNERRHSCTLPWAIGKLGHLLLSSIFSPQSARVLTSVAFHFL